MSAIIIYLVNINASNNKIYPIANWCKTIFHSFGLGVAGLFKMSCDSRSCIVYKGPEFKENNKTVKVNGQCYSVKENIIQCVDDDNKEKVYL